MKNIQISVIIPAYNAVNYIKKAIDSVLNQEQLNYDLEIIIVDDNSTDNTVSYIEREFSQSFIKIISLDKNRGPAFARNEGISKSKGQFIALLDADDQFHSLKLSKQLFFLKENPYIDLVFSGLKEIDENRNHLREIRFKLPDDPAAQGKAIFLDKISSFTPTLFFRRSLFTRIGGFNTDLVHFEDQEFMLKAVYEGTIEYMDELLTYRVLREEGMSKSVDELLFLKTRLKFEKNAYKICNSLRVLKDRYWANQYFGLGKLMLLRKNRAKARIYLYKSLKKYPISYKPLVGLLLSIMPFIVIRSILN